VCVCVCVGGGGGSNNVSGGQDSLQKLILSNTLGKEKQLRYRNVFQPPKIMNSTAVSHNTLQFSSSG
jgi:hypothetical protein